jgi:uncharacterized protein (TIGR00255 family)
MVAAGGSLKLARRTQIMTLKSMTGYGSGSAVGRGVRIDVELNSVNRKQFDVRVGLPKSIMSLEAKINEAIQKAVSRGSVSGTVNVTLSGAALSKCVSVDKDTARAYVCAIHRMAADLGLKDDLTARTLVNLPGVVRYESVPEESGKLWPLVRNALGKALSKLTAMRAREGKHLQKDIVRRFRGLKAELEGIKRVAPEVSTKYRTTLQQRIEKAGVSGGLDSDQLMKEVALLPTVAT